MHRNIVADTLLRTQMFPRLPARATFVADTNVVSGTQKMFLILFRNILCPQQMFPSLRSPRNIMSNNVSATMRPRLLGPLNIMVAAPRCRRIKHLLKPETPKRNHRNHRNYRNNRNETYHRNNRTPSLLAEVSHDEAKLSFHFASSWETSASRENKTTRTTESTESDKTGLF